MIVTFPYGAMGCSLVCDCGIYLWCHGLVCGLWLWHFRMVPWVGLWLWHFLMVPWVGLWSVIVAFPYGAMGWSVVCDFGISFSSHGLVCGLCCWPFLVLLTWYLTLNPPIPTKVVCFSRLLKCLRRLYGKQCGPRSECSYRISQFWVHAVCLYI